MVGIAVTCSFCQEPGTTFTAIIQNGQPKQICRKCIKLGLATPKPRPKPGFVPCFDYSASQK